MKLCNICKQSMGADAAFAKLHNICRTCLESGQDTECLNRPSVELSEWEHANVRQCKDCQTNFIPLWYFSTLCKDCAKRAHAKMQIIRRVEAQIKADKAQVIELGKKLRKEISGITEVRTKYQQCIRIIQRIERTVNEKEARHQRLIAKRIKKYFGSREPFDIPTLCRVLVDRSPYRLEVYAYERLYKYFVKGISVSGLEPGFEREIGRYCCAAYHPRLSWLFQPVKRRSREEKQHELNDRIADVLESQSRIDSPELKE